MNLLRLAAEIIGWLVFALVLGYIATTTVLVVLVELGIL